MNIDQISTLTIDIIEMTVELSIAIFLILLNERKKNALLYLGLFLLACSLTSINSITDTLNLEVKSTYLDLTPLKLLWLTPCLLYLYVKKVIAKKVNIKPYLLFIPGIIEFIFNSIIYFFSLEEKNNIKNSSAYLIFEVLGVFYTFFIIFLILKSIQKHSKTINNYYSSTEFKHLNWVKQMFFAFFIIIFIMILTSFFLSDFYQDILIGILSIGLMYWVAYNGMLQQVSYNISIHDNFKKETNSKTTEIEDQKKVEKYKQVLLKIETLLKQEKLYLNPELTIVHIAEKINEHPRLISTSINNICNINFNNYINNFRIQEAKKMLLSNNIDRLNIEGIGLEAGFKSNSSFYRVFKKQLKITPLQFIKSSKAN